MRARLWHDGAVVAVEEHTLAENLYFAQEVLLMLRVAGFDVPHVYGGHTDLPATSDDGHVVFIAQA